jgi:phospholipid/cholesterol/gamma-HCH transport system substrate-binding protein
MTRGPRRGGRLTPFQAGALTIALIVVATYFGFSKDIPFTRPFELKAVFSNAQNIGLKSPVRIAGVEVGKVSKVEPAADDAQATVVTMKLQDKALPIHKDAELKIRPRIFLEGNFFVDVRPGRPSAPTVKDGDTIPMTQTAAPVQLDQVLGALKTDARADLRKLLAGYGQAIGGKPTAAEDADQDPSTRGETADKSLNDSLRYSADALRGTALVNDALLGTDMHDLSKLIAGGQRVSQALASREQQLQDLITNFNVTTGALASEQQGVRGTVRQLARVLQFAKPALGHLNQAFPPTRAFAREIVPGLRETPATISASFPWIAQTRKLVSRRELQGLVRDLRPAVHDLAITTDATVRLLPQVDLVNRCALDVLLPTGDEVIQDGPLTTGVENYKEFFQTLVGLSGESQNFDGNGQYTRFQPGGGSQTVSTGETTGVGKLFGNAVFQPLGTRPAFPAKRPPYNRKVACYRNKRPNLDAAKTGGGP